MSKEGAVRFLSDRLGVLLHRCRGGGGHAPVHLAVLFRWEKAEAVPVLTRASERTGNVAGGRTDGGRTRQKGEDSVDSHQLTAHEAPKTPRRSGALHVMGHYSSDNCRDCFIMQHRHMDLKTGSSQL
ncbi:uncharacterized protein V6R79_001168 [Siganus canaliculatus]